MKKLASLFAWSFALLAALVIFNITQYLKIVESWTVEQVR
jgi:hypothetical protein